MSVLKRLKYVYLAYLSKPKADRTLFRVIREQRPKSILQLGIGDGARTRRLLEQVLEHQPAEEVRYAGVDLFEGRPAGSAGMGLKQAHASFKPLGVKLQFIPGDPYSALARAANGLPNTDLVLIAADQDADSLTRAWTYFPRMLHEKSLIFREEASGQNGETAYRPMMRGEIESLAQAYQRSQRRAA